jgi:fumarylacetoacetate (FAA) hydrolase family protein
VRAYGSDAERRLINACKARSFNAGCCLLSLIVQFDKKDSIAEVSSGLLGLTVQLWHVLVDRADLTYANR